MDTKSRFRRDAQPRFPQRNQPPAVELPPYAWQCNPLDIIAAYVKVPAGKAHIGYVARHAETGIDIADMFDPQSCMTAMERHFSLRELSFYETLQREKLQKFDAGDRVEVRVREGSKQLDKADIYTIIAQDNPRRGKHLNTHWFAKVGTVVSTDRDGVKLVCLSGEPMRIHYGAMREAQKLVTKQKYAIE